MAGTDPSPRDDDPITTSTPHDNKTARTQPSLPPSLPPYLHGQLLQHPHAEGLADLSALGHVTLLVLAVFGVVLEEEPDTPTLLAAALRLDGALARREGGREGGRE